jgi:hypothetical protein
MDFTIITTKQSRTLGMSLVELLVAVGVSGIVFTAIASLVFYSGRSFVALANYVDLDNSSRGALDRICSEIRQANRLTSYSPTHLDFETVDPRSGATTTLTYNYDSAAGTLKRTYTNQTTTLLKEISPNGLKFSMYQRNPVGGSVEQYSTTDPTLCKVVQMSWTCSRKVLGKKSTTESAQSAKVVIRK